MCIYVAWNCGNQAFPEMPGVYSIALAFEEIDYMVLKKTRFKFWEVAHHQEKSTSKVN